MITLIAIWEKGWLDNKTEHFIWKQLKYAYGVDRLVFVGKPDDTRLGIEWFKTVEEAIKSTTGKLFILNPNAKKTDVKKQENMVFLFGNAITSNAGVEGEHIMIDTKNKTDMFAFNAAAIILDKIK